MHRHGRRGSFSLAPGQWTDAASRYSLAIRGACATGLCCRSATISSPSALNWTRCTAVMSTSGKMASYARLSAPANCVQLETLGRAGLAWLASRGEGIEALFCGIYQGRPLNRPLAKTMVKLIIKEAVAAAGLLPEEVAVFGRHLLRVGAAQDLLCAGLARR